MSNLGPQFSAAPSQTYTSLASNIVFPSNADHLYLDGVEIADRTTTASAAVGSVLGIREGDSVVAVRLFLADGLAGYTPSVALCFDGTDENAGRVVAYHYQGDARSFSADTTCRLGTLIAVQRCTSDAEAAAFLQSVIDTPLSSGTSGEVWSASAVVSGVTLAAALNTADNSIVYRRINGADYPPESFTLSDGTDTLDLAQQILDAPNLDADGNGSADALTDGILILRYLFDPAGSWNYSDALGSGATRTTRDAIRGFLDGAAPTVLDVDGNDAPDALTDGILILRYLFDPAGSWNYSDALGSGATRTTRQAIKAFLDGYNPATAPGSTSTSDASAAAASAAVDTSATMPDAPVTKVAAIDAPESLSASAESAEESDAVVLSAAPAAGAEEPAEGQTPIAWVPARAAGGEEVVLPYYDETLWGASLRSLDTVPANGVVARPWRAWAVHLASRHQAAADALWADQTRDWWLPFGE